MRNKVPEMITIRKYDDGKLMKKLVQHSDSKPQSLCWLIHVEQEGTVLFHKITYNYSDAVKYYKGW